MPDYSKVYKRFEIKTSDSSDRADLLAHIAKLERFHPERAKEVMEAMSELEVTFPHP